MNRIAIVIADDHGIVRTGLRALLERQTDMVIVGEATDGREAVRLVEEHKPDVAVLDIAMPQLNGVEAAAQISRRNPSVALILLSMYSDESFVIRGLAHGIRGYLLKDSAEQELVKAVRSVVQGRTFFSPSIAEILAETQQLRTKSADDTLSLLTERERQVLQMLAEGLSNKEVAGRLSLSTYTVDTHRAHIMQKLNLKNTAELVLYAVRKKLVT